MFIRQWLIATKKMVQNVMPQKKNNVQYKAYMKPLTSVQATATKVYRTNQTQNSLCNATKMCPPFPLKN
jgi:hypothetical protein